MKPRLHISLWLTPILSLTACGPIDTTPADPSINVITFNIRYNNPNDGENAWPNRKDKVASVIQFHQADIVGMQEALLGQIDDLQHLLKKLYNYTLSPLLRPIVFWRTLAPFYKFLLSLAGRLSSR